MNPNPFLSQAPKPGPYVKEMQDAAMFYTNRVLKDYKDKSVELPLLHPVCLLLCSTWVLHTKYRCKATICWDLVQFAFIFQKTLCVFYVQTSNKQKEVRGTFKSSPAVCSTHLSPIPSSLVGVVVPPRFLSQHSRRDADACCCQTSCM